jgi:branched-chain amino acid transport system substrate-binding protein
MRSIVKAAFYSFIAVASLASSFAYSQQDVIKIGEINSYKALNAVTKPYRQGWELAQEEINRNGGVLGKRLETVFRDDNGNAGDAVRVASELLDLEKVDILSGVTFSHVGLAVSDFAKQRKRFFLASGPLTDRMVWQGGNRYTYRLRSGTHVMAASLVAEAVKLNKKRWALLYPNYEYGQAAVKTFKEALKAAQPDVEFVAEQAPPAGRVDAPSIVQAIADAKADAIFNVLFGADLTKFMREANTRNLFEGKEVVSLLTGEPEYLDPLKSDAPENWIVTGYPYESINNPEHTSFVAAYRKKYNDYPRFNSVVGYATVKALAAGIAKAGSVETEDLIKAFKGLEFGTPFGKAAFRPQDNQSTFSFHIGRTALRDGKGYMPAGVLVDAARFQPSDAEVKQLRSAN